ncbi:Unknown protein sequence [Pseudomonas savastanoi pv. glycinea]|nr:Unknown protein sequence [Pseudomonas savastanoi pv. glycinea]
MLSWPPLVLLDSIRSRAVGKARAETAENQPYQATRHSLPMRSETHRRADPG